MPLTPPLRATAVRLAALGLLLAGCGREPSGADRAAEGEDLYLSSCARCHQATGGGYEDVYPALDGSPIVALEDPRPLLDIMLEGSGGMPGFRYSLSRADAARIATYVRRAWGNDAPAVSEQQVG